MHVTYITYNDTHTYYIHSIRTTSPPTKSFPTKSP